jgi:alkylhydroperoxidase family enzyme
MRGHRLIRAGPVRARTTSPSPFSRELHDHFTDPEVVELTFLIGYINMLNLFNNALGVRYHGEYSLLRPVAG